MAEKKRLVIKVAGGLIQSVSASDPSLEVLVIDYDVEGAAHLSEDADGTPCSLHRETVEVDAACIENEFDNYFRTTGE